MPKPSGTIGKHAVRWSLLCLAHLPYLQPKSHPNTGRLSGRPCPDRCLTTIVLSPRLVPVFWSFASSRPVTSNSPVRTFRLSKQRAARPASGALRPSQGECSDPGRSLNIPYERRDTTFATEARTCAVATIAKMDMDMDMGGHSHSSNGFQTDNMELARVFWYLIVGVMGLFAACRVVNVYASEMR